MGHAWKVTRIIGFRCFSLQQEKSVDHALSLIYSDFSVLRMFLQRETGVFYIETLQFSIENTAVFVSKHSSVCIETLQSLNRTLQWID